MIFTYVAFPSSSNNKTHTGLHPLFRFHPLRRCPRTARLRLFGISQGPDRAVNIPDSEIGITAANNSRFALSHNIVLFYGKNPVSVTDVRKPVALVSRPDTSRVSLLARLRHGQESLTTILELVSLSHAFVRVYHSSDCLVCDSVIIK